MDRPDLARRALTEALGTFVLVFAGCGAIVTDAHTHGGLGGVGVALVFFLVLVALISAGGHVSGAHYEALMTAFLVFVVFAVATDTRAVGVVAALAVAATVGCDALFGGPLTGASMNPARSLGPALASGTWTDFWLYLAAPLLGAVAGGLTYTYVRGSQPAAVPVAEPSTDAVAALSQSA